MNVNRSQILNLGSKQPIRLLDLADAICEIMGVDKNHNFYPARIGEAKHAYLSSEKAEKTLGLFDRTPLREGLERTIELAKLQKWEGFDFSILDFDLDLGRSPVPWAKP